MPKVTFVFEDDKLSWATQAWADMDAEDQALARKAWAAAEDEEKRKPSECGELCENAAIRQRMQQYMLHKLKWTHPVVVPLSRGCPVVVPCLSRGCPVSVPRVVP